MLTAPNGQPVMSKFMAFLIMTKRSFLIAWQFLVAISMVFIFTFVVFPGTALHTKLRFMEFIDDGNVRGAWTALLIISLFNIADTLGRWLAGQGFG